LYSVEFSTDWITDWLNDWCLQASVTQQPLQLRTLWLWAIFFTVKCCFSPTGVFGIPQYVQCSYHGLIFVSHHLTLIISDVDLQKLVCMVSSISADLTFISKIICIFHVIEEVFLLQIDFYLLCCVTSWMLKRHLALQ